jgi:hypothetical protein
LQQHSINERLSFLLKTLKLSARAFSESIGEKPTITQNYVGTRNSMPGADYLEKVLKRFESINPAWLLMGDGEPFKDRGTSAQNQTTISSNRNIVASDENGKAIQKNYDLADCERERDVLRAQLDKAQREVELLTGQLQIKDALIASKEETIDLLKAAFNRPN